MAGGRPTKYDPGCIETVRNYCLLGATDEDLARFLDVEVSTVNNWKNAHPEFLDAIKQGREVADANVGVRLYERATGFSHPEDKVFLFEGQPVVVSTTKHYPPDTTACIFWLKNRQRAKWRDKHEVEHSGKMTLEELVAGTGNSDARSE